MNLRKMHSCRRSPEKILDLVFNELDLVERDRLKEQLDSCPACLATLEQYSNTLEAFDRATAIAEPSEAYWSSFEARLEREIKASGQTRKQKRQAVRGLFKARLSVPLPIAAGFALLLCGAIAGLTYSRSRERIVTIEVPGATSAAEIKYVEVPVVKEKVVTKTVYIPRNSVSSKNRARVFDKTQLATFASIDPSEAEDAGSITRANLEGFQPAEDMRLRVIRRSGNGEK